MIRQLADDLDDFLMFSLMFSGSERCPGFRKGIEGFETGEHVQGVDRTRFLARRQGKINSAIALDDHLQAMTPSLISRL